MINVPDLDNTRVERETTQPQLALGQWYWVTSTEPVEDESGEGWHDEHYEWLGCVMQTGSNFVGLESPHGTSGYHSTRVHFDDFWTQLRFEPNADEVIRKNIAHFQGEANRLLGEVKALTARLGLKPVGALRPPPGAASDQSTALVALSGQTDIAAYKLALIEAQDKTLPALFSAIKEANAELVLWMTANTMPMLAMTGEMEGSIDEIHDRIFNVSLYAGLTEEVVQCCKGAAAARDEKLHVMQRRLYMDEECLLNYAGGGMEFKDIEAFDAWIFQPENRDRILPFPRTLVAMRVRREAKDRERDDAEQLSAFVRFQLENADKITFLYIRNGEQIWRLSCDMDFGEMIFPGKTMFSPGEAKMVKMFISRVDQMMSVAEYEELSAKYSVLSAQGEAWRKANPGKSWIENPIGGSLGSEFRIDDRYFRPQDWQPFDQSNVHFDDCMKEIENRVKEYNRIALIIQGLFDRSEVLHPHAPVQSWTPAGFAEAITLVYDGTMVLNYGPPPDFEEYRKRCNASLGPDSIVIGQQRYWLEKEAEKENNRLDGDSHVRSAARHKIFKPEGDPGPGNIAKPAHWKARSRKAIFAWDRERRSRGGGHYRSTYSSDFVRATLTVPAGALFNISAYTPGDYKQFFRDPRTRAKYIKWAPMLLAAENYHAGKLEARQPVAK